MSTIYIDIIKQDNNQIDVVQSEIQAIEIATDNPVKDHMSLTSIGVNTHAQIDIAITQIGVNTADIATNAADIAANVGAIGSNTSAISTNTGNIATNTTDIGTNAGNISTNTTNIATNTGDISTNTTQIGLNTTQIGLNTTQIATNVTDISTNTGNIATNTTGVSTNAGNISTNTTNIATNITDISTNAGNISTNTTNISTNTTNIGTNTTDISTNTTNISTNTGNIGTNTTNIATNTGNIATNTTDIGTNTTDIATNAADIVTNAFNIATNTADIAALGSSNHGQNTDTYLDFGQPNQVSSLELRTHLDDASIHFTEASIDHNNIQNNGVNSHTTIDAILGAIAPLAHTQGTDLGLDTGGANPVTALEIVTHHGLVNEHIDWTGVGAGTIDPSNYVDNDTTDHTLLSNIGTNTHAQIDTHLASTANPHSVTAAQAGAPDLQTMTDQAILRANGTAGQYEDSLVKIGDTGTIATPAGVITSDVVPGATTTMFDLKTTSGVTSGGKAGFTYANLVDGLGEGFKVSLKSGLFGANNILLETTHTGGFDSLDFAVQGILGQVNFFSQASPSTAMGFNPGASAFFTNSTSMYFGTGGGGTGMMRLDQTNKTICPMNPGAYPTTVIPFDLGGDSANADSQIRNMQWKNVRLMGGLGNGVMFEHYAGGSVIDGSILSTTNKEIHHTAYTANGATAIGHIIDTSINFTTAGAKLTSFRNATVEKFAIGKDGGIIQASAALNGFFGVTPVAKPSAYTQTYSATTKTHANLTNQVLTKATGTPTTSLGNITVGGDSSTHNDNYASLVKELNALRVDLENAKQLINAMIDDDQSLGLKG